MVLDEVIAASARALFDQHPPRFGRTDKGLFITTGQFTPAAKKEAPHDGAPQIEPIDGERTARVVCSGP